jgi:8-oxo-dGTP pyrophosphatase MutT (NUDIX family)
MTHFKAGVIITKKIRNDDHFLLVKSYCDIWSFPKGHLMKDEDFSIGASRELYEETGISIDPEILLKCRFKMFGKEKYYLLDLNYETNQNIYIPEDLSTCVIPDKHEIKEISWKNVKEIKEITTNYTVKSYLCF